MTWRPRSPGSSPSVLGGVTASRSSSSRRVYRRSSAASSDGSVARSSSRSSPAGLAPSPSRSSRARPSPRVRSRRRSGDPRRCHDDGPGDSAGTVMGRGYPDGRGGRPDGHRHPRLATRVDGPARHDRPGSLGEQPGRGAPSAGARVRRGAAARDRDAAPAAGDHATVASGPIGPPAVPAVPIARSGSAGRDDDAAGVQHRRDRLRDVLVRDAARRYRRRGCLPVRAGLAGHRARDRSVHRPVGRAGRPVRQARPRLSPPSRSSTRPVPPDRAGGSISSGSIPPSCRPSQAGVPTSRRLPCRSSPRASTSTNPPVAGMSRATGCPPESRSSICGSTTPASPSASMPSSGPTRETPSASRSGRSMTG